MMAHLCVFEQVNKCLKQGNADYAEEAHLQEHMTAESMCHFRPDQRIKAIDTDT